MRYKILRLASAAFAILLVACHEQSEYLFGADAPLVEISADTENEGNFTPEAQTGYALLRFQRALESGESVRMADVQHDRRRI